MTTTHDVLERLRDLYLDKEHKRKAYRAVELNDYEESEFKLAVGEYEGRVFRNLEMRLYDNYLYSLRATDANGVTMFDFLKVHGNFKSKRARSFTI